MLTTPPFASRVFKVDPKMLGLLAAWTPVTAKVLLARTPPS